MSERTTATKKRLQETLKNYPEIRAAIKESVKEMRKPENMKPMVDGVARLFQTIKALEGGDGK